MCCTSNVLLYFLCTYCVHYAAAMCAVFVCVHMWLVWCPHYATVVCVRAVFVCVYVMCFSNIVATTGCW